MVNRHIKYSSSSPKQCKMVAFLAHLIVILSVAPASIRETVSGVGSPSLPTPRLQGALRVALGPTLQLHPMSVSIEVHLEHHLSSIVMIDLLRNDT
ncbi:hypothetical protein CEXT_552801 [Caerostris extrusa]|uniref:Uncharacterized protein n=1 Tax=Caerostris extrusa TaxID=172846 RepID=A0AAV4NBQ1_CAEEX|nr:hypothetical protein CEXT_552801 [Caerostris extrusa]